MIKPATLIALPVIALGITVTKVQALEISVSPTGVIRVYQDGVLGDSTDARSEEPTRSPIKTISPAQEKALRIRNSGDKNDVEIINKRLDAKSPVTKLDSERLRLQLDSAPDREEASRSANDTNRRELIKDVRAENVEQRLEERAERKGEKIELRRATVASSSALELRSREKSARIPEQVEVVIDPETNEVGIVLPSGEIKALNHLPDQAQARIDQIVQNSEELELTTQSDGSVVYTTTVPKVFHFLGIFPRKVSTQVTLDDSTGEITQEKTTATGWRAILNRLSF